MRVLENYFKARYIFYANFFFSMHWRRYILNRYHIKLCFASLKTSYVSRPEYTFSFRIVIVAGRYCQLWAPAWIRRASIRILIFVDEARFSPAVRDPGALLPQGNWSSRVDEPRPMELRPFGRWQRTVWFLWDAFPSRRFFRLSRLPSWK